MNKKILIELPCNVGDTIYTVYDITIGIDEWEVTEIRIFKKDILLNIKLKGTNEYEAIWLSEGETYLFFTKEEAKKRLKELENEQ